ncbi:hypothetical protein P4493_04285 [Bacillus thuringiensis]|jgi:hypothetical protein|uniref:Uncharacterized protein n=3 Tax=Bacillus thuringiensis TaxID=1428 RepID=A0A0B5NPN5_BACTU|nr:MULTISPECIES: hypothetical protein [Bacillus]MEC2535495.1 hypothetical protein [Bacillus cereus]MED1153791.1 hypothetical protein [Bacillus paranthracis]OUB09347.1 hypothetical protein BK708_33020 [Bacillus thuringiensis serovar yunnanensis]AFQ30103.1 hypothetical protein BTF1_30012 [Bacillus thuringiensis HD-789]AJG74073.1 hypothetical protein BF38_5905 [Bacillus thuringiensis]
MELRGKELSVSDVKELAKSQEKWEGKLRLNHTWEKYTDKELIETTVSIVPVKTFTGTQYIMFNFQGDKMRELDWFIRDNKKLGIEVTFYELGTVKG